jgi:hypothetical protein
MSEKLKEIKNKSQYDAIFDTPEKREEALKIALDIRKFEIDLYWKRAAYFWTFIAAAFGAYFLMYKAEPQNRPDILIIIACLGFTFSLAWYLANRGSKFWSGNWELHVDYLEDEILGPLYKTVTAKENFKVHHLLRAYPFSVAKINQVLNLYVLAIWFFLIIFSFSERLKLTEPFNLFNEITICLITVVAIFAMIKWAKTDFKIRHSFHFVVRQLPYDVEPNQANSADVKNRAAD